MAIGRVNTFHHKSWRVILILSIFLAIVMMCASQNRSYADTAQPSSVNIQDVDIYNSLIQANDFLAVVPYTIAYPSTPSDSIDKTFTFEFIDTDGATLLGAVTAYPFYNSGYSQGVVSFYFSANITAWGLLYTIRVAESPAFFTSPAYWDFPVSASDYSAYTANQTANRSLLQTKVVKVAQQLTIAWAISATPLTEQGGSGVILSSYGEAYFRNAIFGLQQMCPSLFLLQNTYLDYTGRSWDYSFTTILYNTFPPGSIVGDAMTGFAGLWGVPTTTTTSYIIFFLAFGIFGASIYLSGENRQGGMQVQASFLDAALVLIWGTLAGWFSPIINALFAFVFILVGGWILLLSRA